MAERTVVTMRVGENGLTWLDRLAEKYRLPRSAIIRHALIVARRHETELIKSIEENP